MKKLFTLLLLLIAIGMVSRVYATTCAQAVSIPGAPTFPYVSSLTCGTTNDITSANSTTCGSGSYKGGLEAVYVWIPDNNYIDVSFAYSGQTWTGVFLYEGCPTSGGLCIGNVTGSGSTKTLTYVGTNATSGTKISVNAGSTYYLVIDTWPDPASPCPGTITINGTLNAVCSGTPAPGNTISSTANACSGLNFNLSLENATTGTGVTYQWQSSPDGLDPWNNIGTSAPTLTVSQTAATYYRCIVTCTGSAQSGTSTPVQVNMVAPSAIPYAEGFLTTTTPSCWNITGWIIGSTRGVTGNPGNNIYKNLYSSAPTGTFLTGEIGPITSGLSLSFDYINANYSSPYAPPASGSGSFTVSLSVDGGATFTDLETVTNDGVAGWRSKSYNLDAYIGSDITIKIVATWVSGDYDLAFDNIKVEVPPSCTPPSNLTALACSDQATLAWTETGTATSWDLEWGPAGFTQGTGTLVAGITPNPTYLLTGLTPSTGYAYYVRAACNVKANSTWNGPKNFTTTISCPQPTSVTAGNATKNSIDISWIEPACATAWNIQYGPAGFTLGTGTILYTTSIPTQISGLTAATSYGFYVQAICGTDSSAWSGPVTGTTLCEVSNLPYGPETFASTAFPPVCWSKYSGVLATPSTLVTGGSWFQDDWRNVTSPVNKAAKLNIWSTGLYSWLMTPQIDLGAGSATLNLEFDLTLNAYATSSPPGTTGTDDKFAVVISTDGGITWSAANTLRLWDNAGSTYVYNSINPAGEHIVLNLAGYSGIVMFGFYGESTVSNADNDLMIDNVVVQEPPACPAPTGIVTSNITDVSVDIAWAGAATVQIEYGPVGHTVGTGTTVPGVTTNPYTLSGLVAATSYDIYVRQDCGSGVFSTWAGPYPITTALCAVSNQCSYTVNLIDAYGDGWNGNILGFKQGGLIVGTFGQGFTTGTTYGPVSVALCDALPTEIVVSTLGSWTEEVGFDVYDPFGNLVYSHTPGNTFTASTVFYSFTSQCTLPSHDVTTWSIDMSNTIAAGVVTPLATVKNLGLNTETFDVTMTIGGYTSTKTVTALVSGATQQVTFDPWNASTSGYFTISVCTALSGDVNPANDCELLDVVVVETGNGAWGSGAAIPYTVYLGTGVGYTDNSVSPPVGYLYSIGGNTGSALGTEVYKYNLKLDTWTAVASLPAARRVLASAIVGTDIYAIGGSDLASVYQNTVYKYNILTDTWTTVSPLPVSIGWAKAVAHGDNIYVAGGVVGGVVVSSVYVYNTVTDTWATATSMPGVKFGGAFSITGNTLVYAAGADLSVISNSVYVGTIDLVTPTTISWVIAKNAYPGATGAYVSNNSNLMAEDLSQTVTTPPSKGYYPGGTMYRFDAAPWGTDGIIMAAGSPTASWAPADPNPCYVYKPATDSWIKQPDLTIPVLGPSLGSVDILDAGTHTWSLIVAGGLTTASATTTATQILTESFAPATKSLSVKLLLEGLYDGAGGMNQAYDDLGPHFGAGIADLVTIELRDGTTGNLEYTFSNVNVGTDGMVNVSLPASYGGNYYIYVYHRNSVTTSSAVAVSFAGSAISYDFTTAVAQAFGDNMKDISGVAVIFAGDVNQDTGVDSSDMIDVDNDNALFATGYLPTDTNGDGTIDSSDMILVDNNNANFIAAVLPF